MYLINNCNNSVILYLMDTGFRDLLHMTANKFHFLSDLQLGTEGLTLCNSSSKNEQRFSNKSLKRTETELIRDSFHGLFVFVSFARLSHSVLIPLPAPASCRTSQKTHWLTGMSIKQLQTTIGAWSIENWKWQHSLSIHLYYLEVLLENEQ